MCPLLTSIQLKASHSAKPETTPEPESPHTHQQNQTARSISSTSLPPEETTAKASKTYSTLHIQITDQTASQQTAQQRPNPQKQSLHAGNSVFMTLIRSSTTESIWPLRIKSCTPHEDYPTEREIRAHAYPTPHTTMTYWCNSSKRIVDLKGIHMGESQCEVHGSGAGWHWGSSDGWGGRMDRGMMC